MRPEYLDPHLIVDKDIRNRLLEGGMDNLLATHFAHLFIRDPIVIFSESLKTLDLESADHFENIQSTNWQHMRFKPPPPGSNDTGWRVEFRPMEIQLTDFENAAFAIFIVLITRVILSFDLNFYIPISLVTENMERAHARNAVLNGQFYFRKDPFPTQHNKHYDNIPDCTSGTSSPEPTYSRPQTPYPLGPVEDEYELMTVDEIINGKRAGFPGLISLVESYLNNINVDVETRCELMQYLALVQRRASGALWTNASWIRDFVRRHTDYEKNSVVGSRISYDLVKAAERIAREEGRGGFGIELLGKLRS